MKSLPLEGLRVIDLSRFWAGPFGTQLLGSMGAEVIRIESATYIDMVRYIIPPAGEEVGRPYERGAYFHMANRNKCSIALDLQHPRGKELCLRLIEVGDVLIENFSARVMGNLGLDYDTLRKTRPDLIVVSMPGFGQTGPYRDYVCFGEALEAMCGLSYLTGYADGPPTRSSGAFTDPVAGLYADYAILAALQRRNRTGEGCYVDLSHQEAFVTLLGDMVMDFTMNGRGRTRMGNRHPTRAPQGVYPCKGEDQWVAISVASDEEWKALCRAMGRPELAQDPGYQHTLGRMRKQEELDALIGEWTARLDHYRVMELLQGVGVAGGAVLASDELFQDPHFKARGFFEEADHPEVGRYSYFGIPVKFSRTPGGTHTPAPLFGQHNRYVFGEVLGLSDPEIDGLLRSGVIADQPGEGLAEDHVV